MNTCQDPVVKVNSMNIPACGEGRGLGGLVLTRIHQVFYFQRPYSVPMVIIASSIFSLWSAMPADTPPPRTLGQHMPAEPPHTRSVVSTCPLIPTHTHSVVSTCLLSPLHTSLLGCPEGHLGIRTKLYLVVQV